jgi:hypothetical protein
MCALEADLCAQRDATHVSLWKQKRLVDAGEEDQLLGTNLQRNLCSKTCPGNDFRRQEALVGQGAWDEHQSLGCIEEHAPRCLDGRCWSSEEQNRGTIMYNLVGTHTFVEAQRTLS